MEGKTFIRSVGKLSWGLVLCFIIAAVSWWVLTPIKSLQIIGPAIFSIFIGMVIGTATKLPKKFEAGINFSSKKILQGSIILLGFEMNINQVIKTGSQSLIVMAATLTVAFLSAYLAGKLLKVERNTNILIGVGTAICGGSAIAATAPVIDADDKEISQSISTIFLFNIVAVFIFPLIGHMLKLGQNGFGVWAGTAINDTSSVVAAASSYGAASLKTATIVKLTRTLMIVPITLFLSIYVNKINSSNGGKSSFSLKKAFPMFVIGFLIASAICTVFPAPVVLYGGLYEVGKFCIAMAMAAIGLKTNLFSLIKNGAKPIALGMACWISVALISLVIQYALGMM